MYTLHAALPVKMEVQCGRLCTTQNRWRWTAYHAALEDYAWWSHFAALSCDLIAQRFAVTVVSKESCSDADITVNTAVITTMVEHWLIERKRNETAASDEQIADSILSCPTVYKLDPCTLLPD